MTLEDFEQTDLILIVGQNPGTNHPRMLTSLEHAKKHGAQDHRDQSPARAGLPPVHRSQSGRVSRPRSTSRLICSGRATPLADMHLPVRINGDIALLKGLMKVMLAEDDAAGGVHRPRLHPRPYRRVRRAATPTSRPRAGRRSWTAAGSRARRSSGPAGWSRGSKRMIACWAMGLTQHRDAVVTIRMLVNLLLLGGHIGRPGAGTCCVRGHSNVQGDRTMGIWERPPGRSSTRWTGSSASSRRGRPGHDTVDTIAAMHEGEIEVFVALGGNFLSATPDTVCTAEALRRCRLTVHIATKLNRSHLMTGRQALILPCLGRSERDPGGFLTVEDAMGVISSSTGRLDPASPIPPERGRDHRRHRQGDAGSIDRASTGTGWRATTAKIRDHIAGWFPASSTSTHAAGAGAVLSAEYRPRAGVRHVIRQGAVRGRAHLRARSRRRAVSCMMTIRSHDQFNTTIYGLHDRYRGVHGGRRVLFMNPDDAEREGGRRGCGWTSPATSRTSASRPVVPVGLLSDPAPLRRGVLPGGERPRADRQRGGGEQHADLQVASRDAGAVGSARERARFLNQPDTLRAGRANGIGSVRRRRRD